MTPSISSASASALCRKCSGRSATAALEALDDESDRRLAFSAHSLAATLDISIVRDFMAHAASRDGAVPMRHLINYSGCKVSLYPGKHGRTIVKLPNTFGAVPAKLGCLLEHYGHGGAKAGWRELTATSLPASVRALLDASYLLAQRVDRRLCIARVMFHPRQQRVDVHLELQSPNGTGSTRSKLMLCFEQYVASKHHQHWDKDDCYY
jgi:hypothetical protein